MKDKIKQEEYEKSLRMEIENILGISLRTPADFDLLRNRIYEKTKETLSSFTLKRFWGYIVRGKCSRTTLDILSRFAEYKDWLDYIQRKNEEKMSEEASEEVTSALTTDQLQEGDLIKLTWNPDREVLVRYSGNETITILDSKNSKLRAGEVYHCDTIVNSLPLVLKGIRNSEGKEYPTNKIYICGKIHGVQFRLL